MERGSFREMCLHLHYRSWQVSGDKKPETGTTSRSHTSAAPLHGDEEGDFMDGRRRLFGTASSGMFGRQTGGDLGPALGGAPVRSPSPAPPPAARASLWSPLIRSPSSGGSFFSPPAAARALPPPRASPPPPLLPVPAPAPLLPAPAPAPLLPAPAPAPAQGGAPGPHRIHVANLPWGWRTPDLYRDYRDYNISKAVVKWKERTCRSMGFGFFTVAGEEVMHRCIGEMNGRRIDGHAISVAQSTRP